MQRKHRLWNPNTDSVSLVTIHPWSLESVAWPHVNMGSLASALWPTANLAILVPFTIGVPFPISKIYTYNGSAAAGNTDVGVYTDEGGTTNTLVHRISAGSTVMAGTGALQSNYVLTGQSQLGPGRYYLAISHSETATGQFFRNTVTANTGEITGIRTSTLGSVVLPATITVFTATPITNYIPIFGITQRSLI